MLYRRLCGLEPSGQTATFDAVPCIEDVSAENASEKAQMLRARAAQCRELAETFYDQSIVSELEGFACELEAEAATLGVGNYPYCPVRFQKRS